MGRYDQLSIKLQCLIETNQKEEAKALAEYMLNLAKKIFAPNAKQLLEIQRKFE